ncbi:DUF2807 domain-containing protein [Flavobacteriaceae bacterium D16]|nr:DUF2807 domain-containing protein [Flavobacteriaceae bacterium D16]
MKTLLASFVFVFLSLYQSNAQEDKITQELKAFREIKAFDGISVNLIPAQENKAVISGVNTNKVAIVNNNGVLKIRMEIDKIFSGYRTFVDIYFAQPLIIIDVNEDARISSEEVFEQEVLEVKAQEGGEIQLKARVEQFLVKCVTGGIIKANGSSANQDVQINTGGEYLGKSFSTEFSTVNVNAGSRAEINATKYVKATVKAGGQVLVFGDPEKMDERTVFGGKITRM